MNTTNGSEWLFFETRAFMIVNVVTGKYRRRCDTYGEIYGVVCIGGGGGGNVVMEVMTKVLTDNAPS